MIRRVLLSWSSGKDSAWALMMLAQQPDVEVAGLLTSFDEASQRAAMHGVSEALVEAQAAAAGLALWRIPLPSPCPNNVYEARMAQAIARALDAGVTHIAFGDLYLEDIRDYRVRMLAGSGIEALFPIWCTPDDTPALARRMLDAGLRAVITCVDPGQLAPRFAGREFDAELLAELPAGVDPCGERGEFHTFCFAGPVFDAAIPVQPGETEIRDGFHFTELQLAG